MGNTIEVENEIVGTSKAAATGTSGEKLEKGMEIIESISSTRRSGLALIKESAVAPINQNQSVRERKI